MAHLAKRHDPADDDVRAELVRRAKRGDRDAFSELVRHHQRRIYYLALRYCRDESDAADITQRTFVRALRKLERVETPDQFLPWLLRIAINLSLNHIRDTRTRTRATLELSLEPEAPIGAGRLIEDQQRQRLRDGVESLPPKQRAVVELRIYQELPYADVARALGCTVNAAKVNFSHAIKRLRGDLLEDS